MKNYISFVNDHSGSMQSLQYDACTDFNANITAIKDAASAEMLDTVVSVCEIGFTTRLAVTVSNPHVLKPKNEWKASGGTPLWSGTAKLIKMLSALPDAYNQDVSFLVLMTTDGQATDSGYYEELKNLMEPLLATGRWTFVARIPKGTTTAIINQFLGLGIPEGNIQQWETTAAGMQASTQATTQAMTGYFRARSSGISASSAFYADASKVSLNTLQDISSKVSLYVVPPEDNGIEIRPFILRHRMEHLKGAAFYQLTKTEARVQHTKQVLIRDRATGKIYAGKEARQMIGLPSDRNARLHPGDHKNYDLFIQSDSVNRKLVGGTGVIYWKEIGVPFTEADLAYLKPKEQAPAKPAVVELPKVPVSRTPTKSPIPVTPRSPLYMYFETRDDARAHCRAVGRPQTDIQNDKTAPKGKRWFLAAKA